MGSFYEDALDAHLEAEYELRFHIPDDPDPDENDYWDEDPEEWDDQ
jgi:hypothetical protein